MTEHDPRQHDPIDDVFVDAMTGETPPPEADAPVRDEERLVASLQSAMTPRESMPATLRDRLLAQSLPSTGRGAPRHAERGPIRLSLPAAALIAASVGVVSAIGVYAVMAPQAREVRELSSRLAEATAVAEESEQAARRAERALAQLTERSNSLESEITSLTRQVYRLEGPPTQSERREDRTGLLALNDTIQREWAPFDLPDAPAELKEVRGDVVWNQTEQRGYLRFIGLPQNDPTEEQYQAWLIDERGLEQKVSAGVFDISSDGEILIPIHPGIAVGSVELFAVTIEQAGGTWVPDLSRRVVVAQRGDG